MSMRRFMLLAACLPLGGCLTIGPDYEAPEILPGANWVDGPDADTSAPGDAAWWSRFDDPLLTRYLETAVRENRDLAAAASRVERAMAIRRAVRAEAGPEVEVDGGLTRRKTSQATGGGPDERPYRTEYTAGLSASWELDLFGGVRRAGEAATARLEGDVERLRAVRLAVLAEVARGYFSVRGSQRRMAVTKANIDIQARTFDVINNLFRLGEAGEFDLSRARGQLQFTQARLPLLDAQLRTGIYRLSILLGRPPGALLEEMIPEGTWPELPDLVPLGQYSDLMRRRPDVRAAERALAASTADIGAASADLFPRFILIGSAGRTADTFDGLEDSLSSRYLFSSLIRWPVFQSGQIRAQVRAEEAEALEAAALYEQAVLEALADAESALVRYLRQRETNDLLRDARASRQRAVALARHLFESGEEDFLSVLDAERELLEVEDELVTRETDAVLQLIALYAALGGGWEPFEGDQQAAPAPETTPSP